MISKTTQWMIWAFLMVVFSALTLTHIGSILRWR